MFDNNFLLGRSVENLVAKLYTQKDYILVAQNFQRYKSGSQGRVGELDLILTKKNLLVIVEVKARSNQKMGPSSYQISKKQLKNIYQTIGYFLLKNPEYIHYQMRFDVAFYDHPKLNIIPSAYTFDEFSTGS